MGSGCLRGPPSAPTFPPCFVAMLDGGNGSQGVVFDVRDHVAGVVMDREGADAPLMYAVHKQVGGLADCESNTAAWDSSDPVLPQLLVANPGRLPLGDYIIWSPF